MAYWDHRRRTYRTTAAVHVPQHSLRFPESEGIRFASPYGFGRQPRWYSPTLGTWGWTSGPKYRKPTSGSVPVFSITMPARAAS